MQGGNNNRSIIKLKSGGSPLELNTTKKSNNNDKSGMFSTERCITYKIGKRNLYLTITEIGRTGRVNVAHIDLYENSGKGGSANLSIRIIKNQRYGVLCSMNTKLSGSYNSFKENYFVPPLPHTELVCYYCRENGTGGCFTLEKKAINEVVKSVKATHTFVVDEELVYNVDVKVTDARDGLSVAVEGPMKLTIDYTKQVISRIRGKMEHQMEASALSSFRNARQISSNGNFGEIEGDGALYTYDSE